MNCLHSFRTDNKVKSHQKVCKNNDFCVIVKPSEKDNILEFNQYTKPDKMPCIIYADIESLIKQIDGCANNPEHISCGYSMWTIWSHRKLTFLFRRKGCMKRFCESLREHAKKYNWFWKAKNATITNRRTKITSR